MTFLSGDRILNEYAGRVWFGGVVSGAVVVGSISHTINKKRLDQGGFSLGGRLGWVEQSCSRQSKQDSSGSIGGEVGAK